jgi:hypothetical protein
MRQGLKHLFKLAQLHMQLGSKNLTKACYQILPGRSTIITKMNPHLFSLMRRKKTEFAEKAIDEYILSNHYIKIVMCVFVCFIHNDGNVDCFEVWKYHCDVKLVS